jgi:hypothetical protein
MSRVAGGCEQKAPIFASMPQHFMWPVTASVLYMFVHFTISIVQLLIQFIYLYRIFHVTTNAVLILPDATVANVPGSTLR